MADEELLKRIDSKLGALLAISLDEYLRERGTARSRPRSIDGLLTGAGLTAKETAALLGKTERAVHLVLQGERLARARRVRKTASAAGTGGASPSGRDGER
jgi:hypothetical protein